MFVIFKIVRNLKNQNVIYCVANYISHFECIFKININFIFPVSISNTKYKFINYSLINIIFQLTILTKVNLTNGFQRIVTLTIQIKSKLYTHSLLTMGQITIVNYKNAIIKFVKL